VTAECRQVGLPCCHGYLASCEHGRALAELADQRRAFEVMVTVPRADGGEPFVPHALPPEVLGCWSADQVVASVTVLTAWPSGAVAAAEALVPELARAAGAVVTVRAVEAVGAAILELARDCGP
jgi:hypothetical protein